MPLTAGTRLGPYEIVEPIGAGGMGEVYRAIDPRLGRSVAIKVSKEQFSERFENEARAVAALNHAHICQIYDVGPNYLVMELIEGLPLAGPMPAAKALSYATQIAAALDAAHSRGIVHRDLKPANVLVTKSGVKLLDFGLAKVESPVKIDDRTVTIGLTAQGAITGTLTYMSPEQLSGKEADARSDLFAFGLVLYELLTGKRAFDGQSAASVIGAILERPAPSIGELAPASVDRVLKRCLEKDPDNRWQTARDLKAALEWVADEAPAPPPPAPPTRRALPWIAAAVCGLIAAIAVWAPWRKPAEVPQFAFNVSAPDDETFSPQSPVSPDGTKVAWLLGNAGNRYLAIQDLSTGEVRRLRPSGITNLAAWSPDSAWLAFIAGSNKLRKMEVKSGITQDLCDTPTGMIPFIAWGNRNEILFSDRDGLKRVSASGGTPEPVTIILDRAAERLHGAPQFLSDGRHFLYLVGGTTDTSKPATVFGGSTDSPPEKNRIPVMSDKKSMPVAAVGPDGRDYLLFLQESSLMAQPIDAATLKLSGEPKLVATSVPVTGTVLTAASASRNGVLVHGTGSGSTPAQTQISWFDRQGKRLGDIGAPAEWTELGLSPDGKRLATVRNRDIWIFDLTSPDLSAAVPARFTFEGANRYPLWSSDGAAITFSRNGVGLFQKPSNQSAGESKMLDGVLFPFAWSRTHLLFANVDGDLATLSGGQVKVFQRTTYSETHGQFSPNEKWIAFESDETGKSDVWVQSFPATGAKWQISNGGRQPFWRPDGKELYFVSTATSPPKMMAVPVKTDPVFEPGRPTALFDVNAPLGRLSQSYAVAPNGRFVIMSPVATGRRGFLTVNTNWFAALKK